jgi:predicted nucleic acid-binding protein
VREHPLLTAIIGEALSRRISAYDAAYVALAAALQMPLITADTALVGKLFGASISVLDLTSFRQ